MTWGMQLFSKWRGKMEDGKEVEVSLAKAKGCIWECAEHFGE